MKLGANHNSTRWRGSREVRRMVIVSPRGFQSKVMAGVEQVGTEDCRELTGGHNTACTSGPALGSLSLPVPGPCTRGDMALVCAQSCQSSLDNTIDRVGRAVVVLGTGTLCIAHRRITRKVCDDQRHPGPQHLASLRRPGQLFLCSFPYVFVSGIL